MKAFKYGCIFFFVNACICYATGFKEHYQTALILASVFLVGYRVLQAIDAKTLNQQPNE